MAYTPNYFLQRLTVVLLLSLTAMAPVRAAEITALRSWRAPDNTRLVIDLSAPVHYRLSPDSSPARVIVEIDDAATAGPLALPAVQPPLRSLRLEHSGNGQRLVIETAVELLPKVFQLPPNEKYGHRLVLDLYEKPLGPPPAGSTVAVPEKTVSRPPLAKSGAEVEEEKKAPPPVVLSAPPTESAAAALELMKDKPDANSAASKTAPAEDRAAVAGARPVERAPEPLENENYDRSRFRNIVVAIDAGHGGEDPGAIGQDGSHEKNVTLAIARELRELLGSEPGITAVLTRDGDYFIPLQERRRKARYEQKADIFVSIHADSAENRSARGASVFALSLKGAGTATSRFARMLAERENRADLIGGVALEGGDDVLRNVLADMVVAGSLDHSLHMARNILEGLRQVGELHSPHVEQAGFAVLKEPGMVSLLVETGFISNPDEEKKLTTKRYQREIAEAVARGVRRYCQQYPLPSTYFAWRADRNRKSPEKSERLAAAAVVTGSVGASAAREAGSANGTSGAELAKPVPVATKATATTGKPALRYVKHKVVRGDSLTELAAHYGVPMRELRAANRLRDDSVKIGQVLKIPVN